ncbi:LysR family transcriptional regulator [Chelatococcus sp. SYSU_G07232]|uniref:LysR family transcriptional regulator n=1 Tax=Chelatococcus albus TaxID=3047466 RepID=A0ABT7AHK0_9HYPH|nr:LysR family transcriptional regulator [Chelatococcus sp. SYSU_G07232]MDJ1158847.1 LysR family transcriptional regulator [Chelatococcus sp. SYSU_G07232]
MPDLNDLSLFAAVVTHGGFAAAARALGLPKSTLSRRVARLEEDFGARLLQRSTRRFAVTEIGEDVYRHCRAMLAEAEAAAEAVERRRAEPCGLVRVSCPPGLAQGLIAPVLPRFMQAHPRVRVQLLISNRRVDLIEEGVDIALRVRDRLDTDADLVVRVLGRSRIMLVASPAYLDAHGRPEAVADLARHQTLSMNERGSDVWTLIGPEGRTERLEHEPRLMCSDFDVLLGAALSGLGVALMPESVCAPALAEGRLEAVLPEWGGATGVAHLVFPSRRGLLPAVRVTIDFLVETLTAAIEDGLRRVYAERCEAARRRNAASEAA